MANTLYKNLIGVGFFFVALVVYTNLYANFVDPTVDALVWVVLVGAAGLAMRVVSRETAHVSILFLLGLWLCFGVGLVATASFVFFAASAWGLGWLARQSVISTGLYGSALTEPMLLGTALWVAIFGVLLYFPVNYRLVYLVICLVPCFALVGQFSLLRKSLVFRFRETHNWMRIIPFWAWLAGLIVISWVLRWASFPSMAHDDHALHLRVWAELLTQHRYSFDFQTQIWSLAPFAVDVLHAVLSLLAGDDARGAMNLGLAVMLLVLVGRILHKLHLPVSAQWLLMVLMATTPMLGNLLLTLQTELMLAVLALAGMRLVLDAQSGWRGQHVLGMAACLALCVATKLPGALLGTTLLCALMLRRGGAPALSVSAPTMWKFGWAMLLVPFGLAFVALHSYVLAWGLTGNPVFPLYNAIFLSPYFPPENLTDPRWMHGFSFQSYIRAFFHTSEFFESADYTAGWQFLFMLPLAVLALLRSSIPGGLRLVIVPFLGFGLAMFAATNYWRYLFPAMALGGVLLAALFIGVNRLGKHVAFGLAIACITANLFFFQGVSWVMSSSAGMGFFPEGKYTLKKMYAPLALLTETINGLYPGARVFYPPQAPFGATLHGTPLYANLYAPFLAEKFDVLTTRAELSALFAQEKIDLVIMSLADVRGFASPVALLREFVVQHGVLVGQEGHYLAYKLNEAPVSYTLAFDLQSVIESDVGISRLMLPTHNARFMAVTEPRILASFPVEGAQQARYQVEFSCPTEQGYFVAQINWDNGNPYYRLVSCASSNISFSEGIVVPPGATRGDIYLTSRDTPSIFLKSLTVGVR